MLVAIVHGAADFRLGNALRRELERGGLSCWFASRDLLAGAPTIDGHRDALQEAEIVAVVLPAGDGPLEPMLEEALGAARHGASVVPVAADTDPEGPADGPFAQALARIRAAARGLAPPSTPELAGGIGASGRRPEGLTYPRPSRSRGISAWLAPVVFAALVSAGLLAAWAALPRIAQKLAKQLKSVPVLTAVDRRSGPEVSLTGLHANSGWMLQIHLREQARHIEYKVEGMRAFVSTGDDFSARDAETGEPLPSTGFDVGHLTRPVNVEVRYQNQDGVAKGPFKLQFNPTAEAIRFTKWMFTPPAAKWVAVLGPGGKVNVYFSGILSHKEGLRAVRYGFDTHRPETNLFFVRDGQNRIRTGDQLYIARPAGSRFIAVDLEFLDGTHLQREFSLEREDPDE